MFDDVPNALVGILCLFVVVFFIPAYIFTKLLKFYAVKNKTLSLRMNTLIKDMNQETEF